MKLRYGEEKAALAERGMIGIAPRKAALFAFLAFGSCAGPMAQRPQAEPAASSSIPRESGIEVGQITITRPMAPKEEAAVADPFRIDTSLRAIADSTGATGRAAVQSIFDRLHRGGPQGVGVMDMSGRAPRTASEALAQGGDCTDLAGIVIALFRHLNIPGGAMLVHFESAPASVDHMVPYAEIGGRRVIVDLQVSTLGQTAQGRYRELFRVTYAQAAWMYHREMGDFQRDSGRRDEAMASYRRALGLFEGDAYVHQNVAVLYERAGDASAASRHFTRAAELDPAYRRDRTRGTYNEELQAAQTAFREQRWADCITHFQAALSSGEAISAQERRTIETNIESCRHNAQASGRR